MNINYDKSKDIAMGIVEHLHGTCEEHPLVAMAAMADALGVMAAILNEMGVIKPGKLGGYIDELAKIAKNTAEEALERA